ncbi:MAG: hypothetical protein ABSG68_14940, partial [Thermoguttaceae bacterium]
IVLSQQGASVCCGAEVCNIKVVTDANPDYTDMGSMIHSITSNWPQTKDKCWALWYWNHVARRQTAPMIQHGLEVTDPIRQFNDYGYTMCSTISGVNCGIWGAMGLKVKFWDISLHTVPEVEYAGRYHMYDNSLSAIYTLCDGTTVAGVKDIGADGACEASHGKTEAGHVARYHCLNATSANGFLTGCDTIRSVAEEYRCFNPRGLKFRYYFNHWDLGHRFILNLRDNEVYTRHYHRMDGGSPQTTSQDKRDQYVADPAWFVPNQGKDPESANPRYHIRGNGVRIWTPALTARALVRSARSMIGLKAVEPVGVQPVGAGRPGHVVFKVEGANVITSMIVKGLFRRGSGDDRNAVSVSTTNGLRWKEVWTNDRTGETPAKIKLLDEVNGAYEVLVKVELMGKAAAADAQLKQIAFETRTMLNSKTQPSLRLGKNTIYVGAGEQTESIVLWPDLQGASYRPYVVEEQNVQTAAKHPEYMGAMFAEKGGEEAYVVFKIDAPSNITRFTYGGRLYNRGAKAHIDFLHSFDGGKTWTQSYSLTDTTPPWDVIHYEKVQDIPPGTRSVLCKYRWNASEAGANVCSLYAVRMEANHLPTEAGFGPMEVTFTWKERQTDYSLVTRSHTQLVEEAPLCYTINVGGADHPVVDSLTVNLKGARTTADGKPAAVKYGYSDGKDAGGRKFRDRWATYGKNLAEGKPYTCTIPSETGWGAGDPDGKVLTDGIVGSPYTGGIAYQFGALWKQGQKPLVTVDLGKVETCAAFCIQTGGYPFWDALQGEVKDQVEVFTSGDGKRYASQGFFDFNLRWKDLPANHAWPDEEAIRGHNYVLTPGKPIEARYVRFAIAPARFLSISEVQVLDAVKYEPFDLKLALPDGTDRSDITRSCPKHVASTE